MSDGLKLISSILQDGGLQELRDLNPEWFVEDEGPVFEFVREHVHNYGSLPDIDTVEEQLDLDLPDPAESAAYYTRRVSDRKTYNDIRDPFRDLRTSLADNNIEAARGAIERLRAVSRVSSSRNDLRTIDLVNRSVMNSVYYAEGLDGTPGITTGWPQLDREIDGYQNGDLITWVARPGMGKTYYLLHSALAAFNAGHRVLFISMEMSLEQLGRRMLGLASGVNPRLIRRGRVATHGRRLMQDAMDAMAGNADRFHLFAGNFKKNVEDVEILMQDINPDAMYIDGVYIMKTNKNIGRGGRFDMALEVFDYLKEMTITHNRPIICTTKFGRNAGKKGGDGNLETIGFTDAVGSNSSLVFGIKEGPAGFERNQRVVEVLKGREGEEGEFIMNYAFSPMDFTCAAGGPPDEEQEEEHDDEAAEAQEAAAAGDEPQQQNLEGATEWTG